MASSGSLQAATNASPQEDDVALWLAFRQGDEPAFARIYTRFVKILYRYGLKITRDQSLIEDCIQDLFIELWNSRERLGNTDSIKFYLFRVMRRKLYGSLSSLPATHTDGLEHVPEPFVESYESSLVTMQELASQKDQLHQALSTLPVRQHEAINLRYFHGFSYEQIAELMGINPQSVHNTLQKAMKVLRAHLSTLLLISLLGIDSFLA
ncbi:RNA polymerase sigma factor [Larkinella bovis]|uniref:RNA polymerase sigma factor n=1 Tax=Larkinella bovis TaxID=683041 RepID=A0ABW0ICN5_9BACT